MFAIEEFDIKLETDFIGRNFIYLDETESTNRFVLNSANNVKQDGSVVLAEFQTAGRGRLDRKWVSSREQNLTFTILVDLKERSIKHPQLLNFVASLVVARSIENLHLIKTNLKWPNDVLVGSKKVAGILCESVSQGSRISKVAVGIGINVNQANFASGYLTEPTSVRMELKQPVSRERLLAEILNNFEYTLARLEEEPNQIVAEWKQFCKMLGDKVTVKAGEEEFTGLFTDVSEEGHIILIDNYDDKKTITFGDVSAI
ncbi:MAG: biotin--[acetyl-CoA-carboxylase] ligase [Ignavibacteria bacterium]|nr:biotin--[acetyl-CoA-carboxylase] ligase [Ignavibacteria bacterium]